MAALLFGSAAHATTVYTYSYGDSLASGGIILENGTVMQGTIISAGAGVPGLEIME